jgi:hypothetical protein
MARSPARKIKYENNAVVSDTQSGGSCNIIEILFAGLKGALVFRELAQ